MKLFLVSNGAVSFIGQGDETALADKEVTLTKATHVNDVLLPGHASTVGGKVVPGRPTRIQVLSNISTFDTVQPTVTIRDVSYIVHITDDMEFYKIYEELLLQATGLVTQVDAGTKKLVT